MHVWNRCANLIWLYFDETQQADSSSSGFFQLHISNNGFCFAVFTTSPNTHASNNESTLVDAMKGTYLKMFKLNKTSSAVNIFPILHLL